jgi:hypothetical protein
MPLRVVNGALFRVGDSLVTNDDCCCGTDCAGCTSPYSGGFEFDVPSTGGANFNCLDCASLGGLYILPGPPDGGGISVCSKLASDVTTCGMSTYGYTLNASTLTFNMTFGITYNFAWAADPGGGSPFDCAGLSSFSLPFSAGTGSFIPCLTVPAAIAVTSTL